MTMKIKLLIVGIIIILIGNSIWESDWFRQKFFPKEYWSEKVIYYEDSIPYLHYMIESSIIELKQSRLDAKFFSFSEKDATEETKFSIELYKEMIRDNEKNLDNAKKELSHYK